MVEKILAIILSLHLAKDLKLQCIFIQSDALNVVGCIDGTKSDAALEPIAVDCRLLLSSFNFSSVMFISKSLNVDAQNLVSLGKTFGSKT